MTRTRMMLGLAALTMMATSPAWAGEPEEKPAEEKPDAAVCELAPAKKGESLHAVAESLAEDWGGVCAERIGNATLTIGETRVAFFDCDSSNDDYATILVVERGGAYWAEVLGETMIAMDDIDRYDIKSLELSGLGRNSSNFALVIHEEHERLTRAEPEEEDMPAGLMDAGSYYRSRVLEVNTSGAPSWLASVRTYDEETDTTLELRWLYGGDYEVAPPGDHHDSKNRHTLGDPERCRPKR